MHFYFSWPSILILCDCYIVVLVVQLFFLRKHRFGAYPQILLSEKGSEPAGCPAAATRPPGGRCERGWGLEGEARRRTRPAGGARADRISRRHMAGGGEVWSTSRWSPPRASAAGVHGELLLPVTASPSACCRPPPRPGAAVSSSPRLLDRRRSSL
jgi:hypothetical protein